MEYPMHLLSIFKCLGTTIMACGNCGLAKPTPQNRCPGLCPSH